MEEPQKVLKHFNHKENLHGKKKCIHTFIAIKKKYQVTSLCNVCVILLFLPCAPFAVKRKYQEDMDSSPAHSDHRKVFPDMWLCPGLYPCLDLCLPVELSIRAWNERTLMLVPVADAQFHHPPTSPAALSAIPSDTVRKGLCRWPHYQWKVCQWSVKNKHDC